MPANLELMTNLIPAAIILVLVLYYGLRNRAPSLTYFVITLAIGLTVIVISLQSGWLDQLLDEDSVLPLSSRLLFAAMPLVGLAGVGYMLMLFAGGMRSDRILKTADSQAWGTLVSLNYSRISINKMRLIDARVNYLDRTREFRGLPASFGLNALVGDRILVRYHSQQPDKAALDLDTPLQRG